MKRSVLFLVAAAICLGGALMLRFLGHAAARLPPAPVRVEWPVMGTAAAIEFGPGASAADRDALRAAAQRLFADLERDLSAWSPSSGLARVNAAAGTGTALPVPPPCDRVYADAFRLAAESGGAFNPLVGPVMRLWGFNGAAVPDHPPADAVIAAIPFSPADAVWTNGTIHLAKPGMRLDLGAIAKGEAVDFLYEDFMKRPVRPNLLIDLGGNLRVLGEARPGRGGWLTAIRNPFDESTFAARLLLTNGEAIATSGSYERFVTIAGRRYSHILDGRTGHPVASDVASVTVVAPSAALADGLSTTLFILGPEAGQAFLTRFYPAVAALWITGTPAAPRLIPSPIMAKKLTTDNSHLTF